MTSGLRENEEWIQRFCLLFVVRSLMLHEIDECMQRLAFWRLNGEQGQSLSWLIMYVCLLSQTTGFVGVHVSVPFVLARAYSISIANTSVLAMCC